MSSRGTLRIAPDLALPDDAVTETIAILAKRGRGKTYCAAVLAEQMIGARLPVAVVDPLGVWWGLRSSADGKHDGLPVVIFGGDHADVPLEQTAGKLIADVLVDERIPAVVDLAHLSKSAMRRFMADFIERLYQRNRDPLHLIVDEADAFAPQRAQAEGARLLGAMEDLVRRGRARGIGTTLITQRPAVLHKDVLTQVELLIVLGMTGPRDVAAIDEWVRLHADEDDARQVKASLPSLPVGTAWVWSPGWLDLLAKVNIAKRTTFDSSATPKAGQRRPEPKRMADVDLEQLGERITATVERAKADDPRTLRRRITELEQELTQAREATPEPERVEVPVIDTDTAEWLSKSLDLARNGMAEAHSTAEAWQNAVDCLTALVEPARRPKSDPVVVRDSGPPVPARPRRSEPVRTEPAPRNVPASVPAGRLSRAQRRVLSVLARHGTRTVTQLAMLTGYSSKGGGFRNALSALRTADMVEGHGDVTITELGAATIADDYDPLPSPGAELIDWWKTHHLRRAEKAIVDVLAEHYPDAVDVPRIAELTDYETTGGGFRNACSRLRTLEVAEGRGSMRLNPTLMGD